MVSNITLPFEPLLTMRQVARGLQISQRKVGLLTRDGHLPAVRIGRAVRYTVADVNRYIASATHSGSPLAGMPSAAPTATIPSERAPASDVLPQTRFV